FRFVTRRELGNRLTGVRARLHPAALERDPCLADRRVAGFQLLAAPDPLVVLRLQRKYPLGQRYRHRTGLLACSCATKDCGAILTTAIAQNATERNKMLCFI